MIKLYSRANMSRFNPKMDELIPITESMDKNNMGICNNYNKKNLL